MNAKTFKSMNCVLCGSPAQFICKYKFHIGYDKKYFGEPYLFKCKKCSLSFTFPSPENNHLKEFYSKIYRSLGRPHYITPLSDNEIQNRHYLTAYCFIQSLLKEQNFLIDKQKKINILEIGAGWGEIGSALNQIFPDKFDIYTVEPCLQTRNKLKRRGYKVVESLSEIRNQSINAVISLHVMEHFANPHEFAQLYEPKMDKNSIIYVEVPNCRFDEGFINRPYDSPHLTFWNYESLNEFSKQRGYDLLSIYTRGGSIESLFKEMKKSRNKFYEWKPNKLRNLYLSTSFILRPILKKIINFFGISLIKFPKSKNSRFFSPEFFIKSPKNSSCWCIVAVFKK